MQKILRKVKLKTLVARLGAHGGAALTESLEDRRACRPVTSA
jgi:hypothetical protein